MTKGEFTMVENPVPWPNGARCAVSFTWDMDADSILHLAHPDDADTRLMSMTDLRYGPEVAVPRICRMFEAYDIPLTFFVPGWSAEEHPQAVERMVEGGHEIAHHGWMHELANTFTKDRQEYWLNRTYESLKKITGQGPRGYRGPMGSFSKYTTEILTALGFLYDSTLKGDDVPYVVQDKKGNQLIEMPIMWALDDWPHYVHSPDLDYMMPIMAPARAREVFMSEFDASWTYGGGFWQSVWHPFVSGRVSRLASIEIMVQEMMERGDVWFATLEQIAIHMRTQIDEGNYDPRIQTMPIKDGRIADIPSATETG